MRSGAGTLVLESAGIAEYHIRYSSNKWADKVTVLFVSKVKRLAHFYIQMLFSTSMK